jgi:anaphase-promoting complex subunit 3
MDNSYHDARHLYATALLRASQPYSALHLVHNAQDDQCSGCFEIKSKCYSTLGKHKEAREALEYAMMDPSYTPTR